MNPLSRVNNLIYPTTFALLSLPTTISPIARARFHSTLPPLKPANNSHLHTPDWNKPATFFIRTMIGGFAATATAIAALWMKTEDIKGDVKEIKGDIKHLRDDFKELKDDFKELRGDIREMERRNNEIYTLLLTHLIHTNNPQQNKPQAVSESGPVPGLGR